MKIFCPHEHLFEKHPSNEINEDMKIYSFDTLPVLCDRVSSLTYFTE